MLLCMGNMSLQTLTLQSQQNLHQVFLGVLRGDPLLISGIFVLSSCSILSPSGAAMFISLSWTCWTCQGFPTTLLFPSSLQDATAFTGHHHHFGKTTHPSNRFGCLLQQIEGFQCWWLLPPRELKWVLLLGLLPRGRGHAPPSCSMPISLSNHPQCSLTK